MMWAVSATQTFSAVDNPKQDAGHRLWQLNSRPLRKQSDDDMSLLNLSIK